ncbi:unnamed protein product [Clonostachys byssicola]|uniref:Uncharacterized protein n=1 Tax=Clonostachys byssicola TaxID=160290 RepID=A0A9N9Y724_9HYPO|nr:unnamed protein product [Clonostachys byssicola]
MSLQLQFEVTAGAIISVHVVRELLKACQEDDLQPLTMSSLESFGQWLAVDRDRLSQGEDALGESSDKSRLIRFANKVFLGTHSEGIISQMRKNLHLTASFLFVCTCTTLDQPQTAELVHELMRLTGAVDRNGTSKNEVSKFVERIAGCGSFLPGESPSDVHTKIASAAASAGLWRETRGAFDSVDIGQAAQLLYEVFAAMADQNVKHVILKGGIGCIWLASLLSWLRPRETVILGPRKNQLYPETREAYADDADRLCVILENDSRHPYGSWTVEKWTSTSDEPISKHTLEPLPDPTNPAGPQDFHCPLGSARSCISWQITDPEAREAVGILASVLVILAVERAMTNIDNGKTVPFNDLISHWFLKQHTIIMSSFGWPGLDEKHSERVLELLQSKLEDPQSKRDFVPSKIDFQRGGPSDPSLAYFLFEILKGCSTSVSKIKTKENGEETGGWSLDVINIAIHLAKEALTFSFCEAEPPNPQYHSQDYFARHDTLHKMIAKHRLDYSELKRLSLSSILGVAPHKINPTDLAVSRQGYVAYTPLIDGKGEFTMSRRAAACFCVSPGLLRVRDTPDLFRRLAEGAIRRSLGKKSQGTSRISLIGSDGRVQRLDETMAFDDMESTVEHLIRTEDDIIYLASEIVSTGASQRGDLARGVGSALAKNATVKNRYPVSWNQSFTVIMGAIHVDKDTSRPAQLEKIAEGWITSGRFDKFKIHWRRVGDEFEGLQGMRFSVSLRLGGLRNCNRYPLYMFNWGVQ